MATMAADQAKPLRERLLAGVLLGTLGQRINLSAELISAIVTLWSRRIYSIGPAS